MKFWYSREKWSDKMTLEAWYPMLWDIFTFDNGDFINGINTDAVHSEKFDILLLQLKTMTVLLQNKSGVSRQTIENIKKEIYRLENS